MKIEQKINLNKYEIMWNSLFIALSDSIEELSNENISDEGERIVVNTMLDTMQCFYNMMCNIQNKLNNISDIIGD